MEAVFSGLKQHNTGDRSFAESRGSHCKCGANSLSRQTGSLFDPQSACGMQVRLSVGCAPDLLNFLPSHPRVARGWPLSPQSFKMTKSLRGSIVRSSCPPRFAVCLCWMLSGRLKLCSCVRDGALIPNFLSWRRIFIGSWRSRVCQPCNCMLRNPGSYQDHLPRDEDLDVSSSCPHGG